MNVTAASLLAVDLGLKTGLALYEHDGRLSWYRSKNYGSTQRLRKDIKNMISSIPGLSYIVVEGDRRLAEYWEREAVRFGIPVRNINAEHWRKTLLYQREQKSGFQAKLHADMIARKVICWSRLKGSTSLRHDAAEAIMIGLWAVIDQGWLPSVPAELRQ